MSERLSCHSIPRERGLSLVTDPDTYDLVFIDANKRRYVQYYQIIRPYLKSGAVILADNTLWADKVLNVDAHDSQTEGIRAFNDLVAADEGVEKVILPLRDGLTLIRVK